MAQREANFDFITDKIDEEQCIIVLGPEVFTDNEGKSLHSSLVESLQVNDNPNIVKYYDDDGFYLFDEAGGKTLTCHQIKKFYDKQKPNHLLQKLVKIPFNIILTVTPDLIIPKAFDQLNIPYNFDYYRKNIEAKKIKTPSKSMPLVYNLFGSVKDEESMVLTHGDLFEYLESVLAANSMPDKLKSGLKSAKNLILVGLPLDKWYFQLLLRLLDLHRQQFSLKRYAANEEITGDVQTFYVEQFKIDFISKDFTDFVENIYKRCEENGMLRVGAEGESESILDKMKNMIAEGDIEGPIDMIKDFLEDLDEELYDMAVGLGGKFKRLMRKSRMGTLSKEDEDIQMSIVTSNLLELINDCKELEYA